MQIIGRKCEIEELEALYNSGKPEFVALYGRRRVGKTYLVKELFKDRFTFWHTGLSPYDRERKFLMRDQLQAFYYSLQDYGLTGESCPKSWLEAFRLLERLLIQKNDGKRLLVFIDELPWMDTARSRFIPAFEHFWNGWAVKHDNIMLIVCGSATTWMTDNVINNKGGLYNRLTTEIRLNPFTLSECEDYFRYQNIMMSRYDIVQAYMTFGGIPHYLSLFDKRFSLSQNIDALLFNRNAKLQNEFDRLFGSLFKNEEDYMKVVRHLATRRSGYSREEILKATKIKDGGGASDILRALAASDFITAYQPFGQPKLIYYRLCDHFCLFYLQFLDKAEKPEEHFWQNNYMSGKLNAWRGHAFEEVCLSHTSQIKAALGISGINTKESSWIARDANGKPLSQMDLIIERADNNVNLCEIKFCGSTFEIDKRYDAILRDRVQILIDKLSPKQTVKLTTITTFGLKRNEYSGQVLSSITIDDLF
ncbi:MAG: ATP-binding protein [Prevotella sp.]|nr:ATP-binding protein [Prevotella sp.]